MRYLSFFVKRVSVLLLSLFLVATLTFFLMHSIPGDPFMQEQTLPQEVLNALRRHYGLDQPLYVQYGKYVKGLLLFDLGPSFLFQGVTTNSIIRSCFPVSLVLGLETLFLAISVGIFSGAIAAIKHNQWQDKAAMLCSTVGISIPSFLMASFLQYIFSMKLNILPVARFEGFLYTLLPSLSMAAFPTAFIARLTRTNMIDVLGQDYIETAKAKGLDSFTIMRKHVLKNSLLPVVTYLGPLTCKILLGSFIVENIFGIPGLGEWFIASINNRDYTIIMGLTVFCSAILMCAVLLVDILYMLLDPRISYEKTEGYV